MRIRKARRSDLQPIISLLADDEFGQARELRSDHPGVEYATAFEAIAADPHQLLAVMEDNNAIIGTLQLTFIPGLARRGAMRGLIEAVRIARARRSEGLGEKLIDWAIAQCRAHGCAIVQLTTDRRRTDAHRFYEKRGFQPTHIGFKLAIRED